MDTRSAEGNSASDVAGALRRLSEALVHALPLEEVGNLSQEALLDTLSALPALHNQLDALQVVLAAEVADRCARDTSLAGGRGCKNSTDLIQRSTGCSAKRTRAQVRLGQKLKAFPQVTAGLATGSVPLESAALIADTLSSADSTDENALGVAELELVRSASDPLQSADDIKVMCRRWGQRLTPKNLQVTERQRLRRRGLRLGESKNGMVSIHGELLPEVGAVLGRLFDAINSPRTTTAADTMFVDADKRTPDQKRHDAFAMVLNLAAQSKDAPLLGGAPITVVINADAPDLFDSAAAGWVDGFDGTPTPVSSDTVRHGACSGAVQHLLRNREGRIISLGNPGRVFNATQRRAIAVRDGGCVIPGCSVPSTWCEVHHVEPHARGGPTHTDNGVALCYYHHRNLDNNGWRVRMVRGMPQVLAPPWLDPENSWREVGTLAASCR